MSTVLKYLTFAGANFREHCHLTGHEKDQRQFLTVGFLSSERIGHLASQWRGVVPSIDVHRLSVIPSYIGFALQMSFFHAANYLKQEEKRIQKGEKENSNGLTHLSRKALTNLSRGIETVAEWQTNFSNDIINVAYLVSYVAIIALGQVAMGVAGLVSMLLIGIKRTGNMPGKVEQWLEPVMFTAKVIADYLAPLGPYYLARKMVDHVNELGHLLLKHDEISKHFPESWRRAKPGTPQKVPKPDGLDIEDRTSENGNFALNFSSIYASEIGDLLPPDYRKIVEKMDAKTLVADIKAIADEKDKVIKNDREFWEKLKKQALGENFFGGLLNKSADELFAEIEEKVLEEDQAHWESFKEKFKPLPKTAYELDNQIQQEMFTYNLAEDTGWKKLGNAVINGVFEDGVLSNLPTVQTYLKAIMDRTLNDKENFKENVTQLLEIGNGCNKNLFRNVEIMVNPDTVDLNWAVHNRLAQFRGDLVKEGLRQEDRRIRNLTWGVFSMDLAGGWNCIHVIDAVEGASWHQFRTFDGERYHRFKGRNIISTVLVNALHGAEGIKKWVLEQGIFAQHFLKVHIEVKLFLLLFYMGYLENCKNSYTVDAIVDRIHQDLLPWHETKYEKDADTGEMVDTGEITKVLQNERKIDFRTIIKPWLVEKGISTDENGRFPEKWVTYVEDIDGKEVSCPTKDLARLLLWDSGVLAPAEEGQ
ncbi:MAG: hypothetical protein WB791_01260 [Waddliaceae bacterium]